MPRLDPKLVRAVVRRALREDNASYDLTTQVTLGEDDYPCSAVFVAKEQGIIAGLSVADQVFRTVDRRLEFECEVEEGARVDTGEVLARVSGAAQSVMRAERTALNLLQRMSGIATLTSRYVAAVSHTAAKIVDTRKTVPGLRALDKYSVVAGGGTNHRNDLSDGVLIKDNHIAAMRGRGYSISQIVACAQSQVAFTTNVEIEADTVEDALSAIEAGADIVLLDNMPPSQMRSVVEANNGRAMLEASGGVTLESVAAIAETGVHVISVGELTHSPRALDIGLDLTYG